MTFSLLPLLAEAESPHIAFGDVLAPYIYVFYAAFILSFLFTPIMRLVASHYGIVDKPDGLRKIHREPIAYLGGVAIFLGWIAGLALSRFVTVHKVPGADFLPYSPHIPLGIVAGGILIALLGLFDDTKGISPRVKIAGQITAALLLLVSGVGTHVLEPLVNNAAERLGIWLHGPGYVVAVPEWLVVSSSAIVVIALVVFACNAANLMDGVDGLCGGVTAIISLGYVFLAVHVASMGTDNAGVASDAVRICVALALLGGVLGFVPYNFNPASIFMGDTGSMFMGFAMAVLMLMLGEVASKWLLAATVMFALPTLDTCLAFVRRYVAGRKFFSADKHHIHHQFLARGLSVKQTVLFLYASAIAFTSLGAAIAFMRTRYAVAVYLVIFGFIIVAAYKMGMVHEKVRSVSERNPIGPDDSVAPAQPGGILELPTTATTTSGVITGASLSDPLQNPA